MSAEIRIKDLEFTFGNGFKLNVPELAAGADGFTALCGPNGAGKTTLLRLMAGILKPNKGNIFLGGKKIKEYTRAQAASLISYVPQLMDETFDFTSREIVAMGRRPYINTLGILNKKDNEKIDHALELFGISAKADKKFNALSGGEKRAVMIARAYAQEAQCILMDEPSAFLDPGHVAMLGTCMRELEKAGISVICVTHDVNFASRICARMVFVKDGIVVFDGPADDALRQEIITEVYGEHVKVVSESSQKTINIKF